MKGFGYLLKACWSTNKKYILFAFLYQVFYIIVPLGSIIIPKYIIDELLGARSLEKIVCLIVLLLTINTFGGMLKTYCQGKMFTEKNVVFNKFQVNIADKLSSCDYEQLENPRFLDVKERAGKFLYADGRGFGCVLDDLFNILGQILVFIGIATILFQLNPLILLFFILLTAANSIVESKVKEKYVYWDLEKAPIERRTFYLLRVIEDFRYGKEIRIYGIKEWLKKKIDRHLGESTDFYKKQVKAINTSSYASVALSFIREIIAYAYTCAMVLTDAIGIGSFTMYISAITQFSESMNSVMKSSVNIKYYTQYSDAFQEYMNMPSVNSKRGDKMLGEGPYHVAFEHVSFRYPGQEQYALRDVNEVLEPGKKIAIIGENGAGKTTFVKLLLRLYIPTEGRILLNGTDYLEYDYREYLKVFGVVFQDYNLFSFTLRENVAFRNEKNLSDREISSILELSGLRMGEGSRFAAKGVETYLNRDFEETGVLPSGGEGQKIALARALYKDADIILLDEPTAALDPKAERELYSLFGRATEGKTAVFISHRLASCRFCDRILVFQNGEIIENGNHEELMEEKGTYAEMFRMQAELYRL